MGEQLRSVEVIITVDTNKQTKHKTLQPLPGEDWIDFIERIREHLEAMTNVG